MTPMDDGLLSKGNTTRRDPSQRILSGMDRPSRWKAVRTHPWSVVLGLVAPCLLVAASMFLMPLSQPVDGSVSDAIPAIALPTFVDTSLAIAPFHASVSSTPVIAAPLRIDPKVTTRHVARVKGSPARKRGAAVPRSTDVAVLSVLVEHIDAQRREASRRAKAD